MSDTDRDVQEIRDRFGGLRLDVEPAEIRRRAGLRGRRRAAAASVGTVALLATVFAISVPGTADVAIAGWTVEPGPVDAATATRVHHWCGDRAPDAQMPVLVDQRGNAAVALYVAGATSSENHDDRLATCLLVWDADVRPTRATVSGGSGSQAPIPAATGPVSIAGGSASDGPGGGVWTVYGRVDPRVAEVIVRRDDGVEVGAQVDDGWWVAFWPGDAEPIRVDGEDQAGRPLGSFERTSIWRWTPTAD